MKLYVYGVTLVATALSCSSRQESSSESRAVEGVYVMTSKGEFSQAEDTLLIHPMENQTTLFSLERKVGFQRKTEKGLQSRQMKQERSMAVWDESTGQLKEQKHGRVYHLSKNGRQLQIGSGVYQKIADQ